MKLFHKNRARHIRKLHGKDTPRSTLYVQNLSETGKKQDARFVLFFKRPDGSVVPVHGEHKLQREAISYGQSLFGETAKPVAKKKAATPVAA